MNTLLKEWLELLSYASAIIAAAAATTAAIFISRQIAHMKRGREVDTFLRILEAGNTEAIRLASLWVKTKITPETTYEETAQAEYRENTALIINHFEMIGILVQRGYISKDLIYDQMGSWIVGTWAKLRVIIAAHRSAKKSPQYAENFELLVTGYDVWAKNHPPKLEKRQRPSEQILEDFYADSDKANSKESA
jgi:hypothetical protein